MRKSKIHKWAQPYKRKVHIDDEIWTYRIAYPHINIRNPQGTQTFHTDVYELSGTTEEEFYKYYAPDIDDEWDEFGSDFPIFPSEIKKFIKEHIINALDK